MAVKREPPPPKDPDVTQTMERWRRGVKSKERRVSTARGKRLMALASAVDEW
jgi:hypothetical protein